MKREIKIGILAFVLGVMVTASIMVVALWGEKPSVSKERLGDGRMAELKADFDFDVPEYLERDKELFEYVKETVDTDSVNPRSWEEIAWDVREMTYFLTREGLVEEKLYLEVKDENLIILLSELAAMEDPGVMGNKMIEMLSSWYHGDVGKIYRDHNRLAEFDEKSIPIMWDNYYYNLHSSIRERAIQNSYTSRPIEPIDQEAVKDKNFVYEHKGRYFAVFNVMQAYTQDEKGIESVNRYIFVGKEVYMEVTEETTFDKEMSEKENVAIPIVLKVDHPDVKMEELLAGEYIERREVSETIGLLPVGEGKAVVVNRWDTDEIGKDHPSRFLGYEDYYDPSNYSKDDKSTHAHFYILNGENLESHEHYSATVALVSLEDNMYIAPQTSASGLSSEY